MADEDVAAERARLEALAWGSDARPEDAAAARTALAALDARRSAGSVGEPGGTVRAGRAGAVAPKVPEEPQRSPEEADRSAEPGRALEAGDDGPGAVGGGAARLQAGPRAWRTWVARLVGPGRRRAWTVLGAAAALGVTFAAGTLVGTTRAEPAAAPTVTPTAGAITLEDLLDAPQTYADQLPGALEAPISLRSTRLIFSNRALDGGSFATPWNVWAGVGTDRSTICLVATANRIESTSACYPRQDALHGSVSLSAQSTSGTLTLMLRGGGVQGSVTNAD